MHTPFALIDNILPRCFSSQIKIKKLKNYSSHLLSKNLIAFEFYLLRLLLTLNSLSLFSLIEAIFDD